MTIKKINKLFINFLIFTVLFSFTYLESKETCIPDFVLDTPTINVTPLNDTDKNPVYVLFDGSLSMEGFVDPSIQDTSLYVEVIDDLQQIEHRLTFDPNYFDQTDHLAHFHPFDRKILVVHPFDRASI